MYKLSKNPNAVIRISDNATIPFDIFNNDYVDYLVWINAGNIPQPAQTPAEIDADAITANNADIQAKLESNDRKIIRALVEGDTIRINAHKAAQAALRAQLNPPIP